MTDSSLPDTALYQSTDKVPLVIGASGKIGQAIMAELSRLKKPAITTTRCGSREIPSQQMYLDLRDDSSIKELNLSSVSCIVFCAGVTSIEECKRNPEETKSINVDAFETLVKKCRASRTPVTLISSNAVFDGKRGNLSESSIPSPDTDYGIQKLSQEKIIRKFSAGKIIRLTKALSINHGILKSWRDALESGSEIQAFGDIYLSPVSFTSVAEFVVSDLETSTVGIRHLSANKQLSYYQLASIMCNYFGKGEPKKILSTSQLDSIVPIYRPQFALLDCERQSSRSLSLQRELEIIFASCASDAK